MINLTNNEQLHLYLSCGACVFRVCATMQRPSGPVIDWQAASAKLFLAWHSACKPLRLPVVLQEISSKAQLEKFVQSQPENVLTVVNVSSNNATPCVRVFPAVMALAKNFTGYAAFARLLYETSQETQSLANELRVLEVSLKGGGSLQDAALVF